MSIKDEIEKLEKEHELRIELLKADVAAQKELIYFKWQLENQPQPQPQYHTTSNIPFIQSQQPQLNDLEQSNRKYGGKNG